MVRSGSHTVFRHKTDPMQDSLPKPNHVRDAFLQIRMKGVTLLEFLVAISLFSLILFLSYHSFEEQRSVVNQIESRTRPEEESNYRMLLIKHFVEKSSSRLKVDPFLEGAQIFFPDLSFGSAPQKNAFSIAHVVGEPFPFVHSGNSWQVPLTA